MLLLAHGSTLEMEGQVKYALHYGIEYLVQLFCTTQTEPFRASD